MTEQLKVDLDQLHHLQGCLDRALAVMEQDFEKAFNAGVLTGDVGLGSHIMDFSESWKKHRFDIRDRLTWMKDSLGKIETSFVGIDTELAKALTAPPKAAAATQRPNSRGSIAT